MNRAPLVVLIGQQDRRHLAQEPFLAGRLDGLAGEYPVWVDQPVRAQDVPGALARAWHEARTAAARARDRADGRLAGARRREAHEIAAPERRPPPRAAEPAAIAELADLLEQASSPVLVVGAGADDPEAWAALVELAERLAAPSGRRRSARAPASRRTTPLSPATCPPAGAGCARRSPATTWCWPWARRSSASTPTSRGRWSSRARAWRS